MYDMYPDWGPARSGREPDAQTVPAQTSLDLRDDGGERPTDN